MTCLTLRIKDLTMKIKKAKDKATILFADQALSFGGSIVVLGSLVEAIDKEKFRPVVVGEMDESILNYHMQGQAKIYVVPRLFNYAHWERISSLVRKIKPRFLFKLTIYLLSAIRSLVNILYVIQLIAIILKEKVDLVHVNNGMSNLEPVLAALLLRRKIIVHFHGIESPGLVQRLLLRKVDRFISISEFLWEELVKNGFPEDRMTVIPNPVQETHAISNKQGDLRKQYGLNEEDKVFSIVGRIVRWKGHIEFLKAAFLVLDSNPDAKALIVGDFSDGDAGYQEKIEKMIEDSSYRDRVIMTGYVKDVSRIYSITDVCVHTSIEPEPFGLVIIEAMANGVPVVASDIGAPPEIIRDKINGYLVSPTETTKLADRIKSLLDNDRLRGDIGRGGCEHVRDNYNIKNYVHSVEQVYRELLEKCL